MKKLILSTMLALFAGSAFCSVLVHYDNKDGQGYYMKVMIDGAYKEVKIENGKKASLTIQGGNAACVFVTGCGEVEVNNGDRITIKDHCITVHKSLQHDY